MSVMMTVYFFHLLGLPFALWTRSPDTKCMHVGNHIMNNPVAFDTQFVMLSRQLEVQSLVILSAVQ